MTGSLSDTVGFRNPFRYRGYYYDTETGLYYLNTRYYDPQVGRFLNADGIIGANGGIQGYNMFAYCNNNPVMLSDPSGLCVHNGNFYDCDDCKNAKLAGLYDEENTSSYHINNKATFDNSEGLDLDRWTPFLFSSSTSVSLYLVQKLYNLVASTAVRDPSIGVGTFAKAMQADAALTAKTLKGFTYVYAGVGVGLDVAMGIAKNVENDASFGKIAYDAAIDLTVSGGLAASSIWAVTAAGTAICPGVGTAIGLAISALGFILFDIVGWRDDMKGLVN